MVLFISLVIGQIDGEPVVVSGSEDLSVRLWHLDGRDQLVGRHDGVVTSVAIGHIDGEPVVVSGSWDNTVHLWHLDGRDQLVVRHDAATKVHAQRRFIAVGSGNDVSLLAWQ